MAPGKGHSQGCSEVDMTRPRWSSTGASRDRWDGQRLRRRADAVRVVMHRGGVAGPGVGCAMRAATRRVVIAGTAVARERVVSDRVAGRRDHEDAGLLGG